MDEQKLAKKYPESTFAAWAEVFTIFAKYEPYETSAVTAAHGEIWAGGRTLDLEDYSEEDRKRLEELKWRWDDDIECWHRYV